MHSPPHTTIRNSERWWQRIFIIPFPIFINFRTRQQLRPPHFQAIFIVSDRKDILHSPGKPTILSQKKMSRAALPFLDNYGGVKMEKEQQKRQPKPEKCINSVSKSCFSSARRRAALGFSAFGLWFICCHSYHATSLDKTQPKGSQVSDISA